VPTDILSAVAISVGVVEDEAFSRTALTTALRAHGVHVLFETDSAATAVELFTLRRPRVGILDIHLGAGPTGVDLATRLRRELPTIGLVFLTSFDEPRLLGDSLPPLPVGAQYLTKSSVTSMTTLLRAIEAAARWGDRRVVDPAPIPARRSSASDLDDLTDEQLDTLRLVAAGYSNAEIARRRVVREKSVEVMIGRIAKRLGLEPDAARNQRVHLARVYLRTLGAKDPGA
jgi:two-component system, NarL family, nitrate/nitrite response regulator NarL